MSAQPHRDLRGTIAAAGRLRMSAILVVMVTVAVLLAACPQQASPTPVVGTAAPAATSIATRPVPVSTPLPYMPPLQYFISSQAKVLHIAAADTDDDGTVETLVLYRDNSRPGSSIRGLIAEPPTVQTPTPSPSSDTISLPDVYWLGSGAAQELFRESWEGLRVEDINGDGLSELLLEGRMDADTSAVHVFQWDGQGYAPLLSFETRGQLSISEIEEVVRFDSVERPVLRSPIVTLGSAAWADGRYLVSHDTTWESDVPSGAPNPEVALLHYYDSLAKGDIEAARDWLSGTLRDQLAAEDLAERLKWLPDLRLETLELLEETSSAARVMVTLRWTDPLSGETVLSRSEEWSLLLEAGGWRLDRLNGTPLEPEWRSYNTEDGLTDNLVTDLLIDHQARLWMACGDSGVVLWDGTYWSPIREQEDGLSSDTVHAQLLDGQNRHWFATAAGVTVYDGLRWITYTAAEGLPDDMVFALTADEQGQVWAGTRRGAALFTGDGWQPVALPEAAGPAGVSALLADPGGGLWFGLEPQMAGAPLVAHYEGASWDLFGPAEGLVGRWASSLAIAPDGTILAGLAAEPGMGGGLSTWTGKEWRVQTAFDTLVDVSVYDIAIDAGTGSVWIGTEQGAAYGVGPAWTAFTSTSGLAADVVHSVAVDDEGDVYFGTVAGLTHFRDAVPLQIMGGGH